MGRPDLFEIFQQRALKEPNKGASAGRVRRGVPCRQCLQPTSSASADCWLPGLVAAAVCRCGACRHDSVACLKSLCWCCMLHCTEGLQDSWCICRQLHANRILVQRQQPAFLCTPSVTADCSSPRMRVEALHGCLLHCRRRMAR